MNYDKKVLYAEKIEPLVQNLRKECVIAGIPFYFSACVFNDENRSEYKAECSSPAVMDIRITQDYFPEFIKAGLGMKVIEKDLPSKEFEDEFDENDILAENIEVYINEFLDSEETET